MANGSYRGDRHGGGDAISPEAAPVPPPPEGLSDTERSTWIEVAEAVDELGTFARPFLPAFRLTVRALARVYDAPADLKPSTMRGLLENASKMLGRFGLDPVSVAQCNAAEMPEEDEPGADPMDEFGPDPETPFARRARIRSALKNEFSDIE